VGVLLNAFAPDRVVLGGGVMMAGQIIIDTVLKYLPNYCWASIFERCDLVAARCGEDAGVMGAAALAFDHLQGT
jgi:glucokinase